MTLVLQPGESLLDQPFSAISAADQLTGSVTARSTTDAPSTFVWKLDASMAGTQIGVVADVARYAIAPSASFIQDETNIWTVSIVEYYSVTDPNNKLLYANTRLAASASMQQDEILPLRYPNLPISSDFAKLIVPQASVSTTDAAGYKTTYHGLFLAVEVTNGTMDDLYPSLPIGDAGRFMVTTGQIAGQRDAAWGNWVNTIDISGLFAGDPNNPLPPDPNIPTLPPDPTVPTTPPDPISADFLFKSAETFKAGIDDFLDANSIAKLANDVGKLGRASNINLFDQSARLKAIADADITAFDIKGVGLAKDLSGSLLNDLQGPVGVVMDLTGAAMTAVKEYNKTGNFDKAATDGLVQLAAALVSGKAGELAGLGAAGTVALVSGSSLAVGVGLPILTGLTVGFAVQQATEPLVTEWMKWGVDQTKQFGAPAAKGAQLLNDSPIEYGEAAPEPTWRFNSTANEFKWLDPVVEAQYPKLLTLFDLTNKPVGLSIKGDQLSGPKHDYLSGHGGSDTLSGGLGNDVIRGGAGADSMKGGSSRDFLSGGNGKDVMLGGVGRDTLAGGAGNDILTGGAANDLYLYNAKNFGKDVIEDFGDVSGNQDLIRFSKAVFSDFSAVQRSAAQIGDDVVIGSLTTPNEITLKNTQLSTLDASDFTFY